MLNLRVTNSASGAGTQKLVKDDITILEVMEMPEFSSYLVGNSFMLNGSTVKQDQWSKPLVELGANPNGNNILTSVKESNGAC